MHGRPPERFGGGGSAEDFEEKIKGAGLRCMREREDDENDAI